VSRVGESVLAAVATSGGALSEVRSGRGLGDFASDLDKLAWWGWRGGRRRVTVARLLSKAEDTTTQRHELDSGDGTSSGIVCVAESLRMCKLGIYCLSPWLTARCYLVYYMRAEFFLQQQAHHTSTRHLDSTYSV
jgi:hypothetical protein